MPKVEVNDITRNYDLQGSGEPLVLIPCLTADHACYAFSGRRVRQAPYFL